MATKKRKAKTKTKKDAVQINWGVIGFIALIILAVSAWQISTKPQAGAATKNLDDIVWAKMVNNLHVDINPLNGNINLSWVDKTPPDYRTDGYDVRITPLGADKSENFALKMSDTYTNVSKDGKTVMRYATIPRVNSVIKATSATVEVDPMPYHPVYNPNSRSIPAAGATATVLLTL